MNTMEFYLNEYSHALLKGIEVRYDCEALNTYNMLRAVLSRKLSLIDFYPSLLVFMVDFIIIFYQIFLMLFLLLFFKRLRGVDVPICVITASLGTFRLYSNCF